MWRVEIRKKVKIHRQTAPAATKFRAASVSDPCPPDANNLDACHGQAQRHHVSLASRNLSDVHMLAPDFVGLGHGTPRKLHILRQNHQLEAGTTLFQQADSAAIPWCSKVGPASPAFSHNPPPKVNNFARIPLVGAQMLLYAFLIGVAPVEGKTATHRPKEKREGTQSCKSQPVPQPS
jgi:hypothetical protein